MFVYILESFSPAVFMQVFHKSSNNTCKSQNKAGAEIANAKTTFIKI